ncbi:MAG: sensor histidine kinase [Alkalispirochaetaceae bacterium]
MNRKKPPLGGGRSIAARLFIHTALAGVLVALLLGSLTFVLDYRREMASLENLISGIEEAYLPALSLSVFNFDLDQAELLLEGIILSGDLAYAEVAERQQERDVTLLTLGEAIPEEAEEFSFPLETVFEGERRVVGELTLYADMNVVGQRVYNRAGRLLLTSALQVTTIALLILWIVATTFVRPLRQTAAFVKSIDLPRLKQNNLKLDPPDVRSSRSREFTEIAAAINDMVDRLSKTYRDLDQTKEELSDSVSEKEALLRELYHRTKNNMQVILSMISLQASELSDSKELQQLLGSTRGRIYAMALVHDKLYRSSNLSRVSMDSYVEELASYILDSNAGRDHLPVRLETEIEPWEMLIDTAIPCGLVLNELITNAIEHAFGECPGGTKKDEEPTIRIALESPGERTFRLRVEDNGCGFPDRFEPRRDGHMGLETVYAIVEDQLEGEITFTSENGLSCEITFADLHYDERV